MENIMSSFEDIAWLKKKLKEKLSIKIHITSGHEVLESIYTGDKPDEYFDRSKRINFAIKYNKDHFLRLQIDDFKYYNEEKKYEALNVIYQAISSIEKDDGSIIGLPLASYKVGHSDDDKILTIDWAFSNVKEYIKDLENNTMFDDGANIYDLMFFNNNLITLEPNQKPKKKIKK